MIARLLALALLLASGGCATVQLPSAAPARTIEWEHLAAPGLPEHHVTIWLPPGYDAARGTYPVLYMWDGQNLFDPAKTHYGKAWMVDRVLTDMVAKGTAKPHIVVGIWSPEGLDRYRHYLPQPAADGAAGEVDADVARMAGGPVASARELAWVADVLKPRVDRTFRTRTAARDTTIIGSSMGGVMACYAIVARPDIFGRAGCVSAHWPVADPDLADKHRPEILAAWRAWLDRDLGQPEGRRIWLDHGTATLDAYYGPWQDAIAQDLTDLGWVEGRDFTARTYPGAEHDEIYWNRRLPEMLAWLWR